MNELGAVRAGPSIIPRGQRPHSRRQSMKFRYTLGAALVAAMLATACGK